MAHRVLTPSGAGTALPSTLHQPNIGTVAHSADLWSRASGSPDLPTT